MSAEEKKKQGPSGWACFWIAIASITFLAYTAVTYEARVRADELEQKLRSTNDIVAQTIDFFAGEVYKLRLDRDRLQDKLNANRVRIETLEESIDPENFRWAKIKLVRDVVKKTAEEHGFNHGFVRTEDLNDFAGEVVRSCEEFDVPIPLALAVTRRESAFRPSVVSHAGAIGLMQVMPSTGDEIALELGIRTFKTKHLFKIETNTRFGIYYLSKMLDIFERDENLAVRAYNMGPTNVKQVIAGEKQDYFYETKCYRAAILGNQGEECANDPNAMSPEGFRRYYEKQGL